MLQGLCGNKNIQRLLLFLFVNSRCYGAQVQRTLKVPLTPLQKALDRLEKGGILTSYYEGKTRLYQFNPAYPLLHELEELLKKAYSLMPAQEQKKYYSVREYVLLPPVSLENSLPILMEFWQKLLTISKLTFAAKIKTATSQGAIRKGQGEVLLTKESASTVVFTEKGIWQPLDRDEINFSNVYRWTLNRQAKVISLEHLRRGAAHPVFLFNLTPSGKQTLQSIDAHLCQEDTYFASLYFDDYGIGLKWRVMGPKKNEEMEYHYS